MRFSNIGYQITPVLSLFERFPEIQRFPFVNTNTTSQTNELIDSRIYSRQNIFRHLLLISIAN